MLTLFFCALLPCSAALTSLWAFYRYPQLWRSSLNVLLVSSAIVRVVYCLGMWTDIPGLHIFCIVPCNLVAFCFLVMLILRIREERKYERIPPNNFHDTAHCIKDLVDCLRLRASNDESAPRTTDSQPATHPEHPLHNR